MNLIIPFDYIYICNKAERKNYQNMKKIDLNTLDKINSCHSLISLIEKEEERLRAEVARRKHTYKGRYINLVGYKTFFEDHDQTKQASSLEFDIEVCSKALGKKLIKSL